MNNSNIFLIICNITIFLEDLFMEEELFQKNKVQMVKNYNILIIVHYIQAQ